MRKALLLFIMLLAAGATFGQDQLIVTAESAEFIQTIFVSRESNLKLDKLYYTSSATAESRLLFSSQDTIIKPKIILLPNYLLLCWQTQYLDRRETYLTGSLDQGKHFDPPRPFPNVVDPAAFYYQEGKLAYSTTTDAIGRFVSQDQISPSPQIVSLADKTTTNSATLEIRYRPNSISTNMVYLEIADNADFPPETTWSFYALTLPGSTEYSYRPPVRFNDGQYFVRLYAFDGLATTTYSKTAQIKIDTAPPKIFLTSPTIEASIDSEIVLSGSVEGAVKFSLNSSPLTLEANGRFSLPYSLKPGKNLLLWIATDEAGNTAVLTKTISYSNLWPQVKLFKPKAGNWFKPGSSVFFDCQVSDAQNDLEDESEAKIIIEGRELPDRLVLDKASGKLSGFVVLSRQLTDGIKNGKISLADQAGNLSEKGFTIAIDSIPPYLASGDPSAIYTNSITAINIPLVDGGSGLDTAGTVVKIRGISFEAVGTGEAIILKPVMPLSKISYEVELLPRDRVGNTAEVRALSLLVDLVPPQLTVFNAGINGTVVTLTGEATDRYFDKINIYNGSRLIDTFRTDTAQFTRAVPLTAGRNVVNVEAVDLAGNKTISSLVVEADNVKANALISKLNSGPNPFSPGSDGTMHFFFTATTTPEIVKVYIFDLTGTLVWKKELANPTVSDLEWNGFNHFGQRVENGLYPYIFCLVSGNQAELRRGKIIVLN